MVSVSFDTPLPANFGDISFLLLRKRNVFIVVLLYLNGTSDEYGKRYRESQRETA